jgi:hypothetical protein
VEDEHNLNALLAKGVSLRPYQLHGVVTPFPYFKYFILFQIYYFKHLISNLVSNLIMPFALFSHAQSLHPSYPVSHFPHLLDPIRIG